MSEETEIDEKWSGACAALKEALEIHATDEPQWEGAPEEALDAWSEWLAKHTTQLTLDTIYKKHGVQARFEGKKQKIIRLIKWAVD